MKFHRWEKRKLDTKSFHRVSNLTLSLTPLRFQSATKSSNGAIERTKRTTQHTYTYTYTYDFNQEKQPLAFSALDTITGQPNHGRIQSMPPSPSVLTFTFPSSAKRSRVFVKDNRRFTGT